MELIDFVLSWMTSFFHGHREHIRNHHKYFITSIPRRLNNFSTFSFKLKRNRFTNTKNQIRYIFKRKDRDYLQWNINNWPTINQIRLKRKLRRKLKIIKLAKSSYSCLQKGTINIFTKLGRKSKRSIVYKTIYYTKQCFTFI